MEEVSMATERIREFLDGNHARYVFVSHSPAYTAQEIAASMHIPGCLMAKTIVVRIDGQLALAVVPATKELDPAALARVAGAHEVEIAPEGQFVDRFGGCQLGTAPPFGNLFGMDTYIDAELVGQQDIVFNAGTHTDAIWMRAGDYQRLARPVPARISRDRQTVHACHMYH
jgi:Ala-tRNA(Pro) deacylase